MAQLVSVTGTQVSVLALPTLAVLFLHASPLQVSLLFTASYLAEAVSAPFAGVLVDAVRSRRRLLMGTEASHACVVGVVPVSHMLGELTLPLLFAVAVLSGATGGITTVAVRSAVSRAVPPEEAVPANAAVAGARTAGQIAGPALAGWLIQVVGAVTAVTADAASYLLSALIFRRLPVAEESPGRPRERPSLREGVALLTERPILVRIAVADAALNLGGAALGALYVVYLFRYLRLPAAVLGLTLMVQNAAAICAVATASRVVRRLGLRRVIRTFAPAAAASLLLIPAASRVPPLAALAAYGALFGFCTTLWGIGSTSLQQVLVAPSQLGRVSALSRAIGLVTIPAGALIGGVAAERWGIVATQVLFALVALTLTTTVTAIRSGKP